MTIKDFSAKRISYFQEGKHISQIHLYSGVSFYESDMDNIHWHSFNIEFYVKPKNYLNPPEKGYFTFVDRKDIQKIILR